MEDGAGRHEGPIDKGRGWLVNLIAALLVSALLLGNLLALGLSIGPVLQNAGRTYEASTSGELVLPFYPDGSSVCGIDAPSSMLEGTPFNVTLAFDGGERPYPIQFIQLRSELGELRFRLWDSWTPEGEWRGWTRVPGLEGGVNWTVQAWSGWDTYLRTTPGGYLESYGGLNGDRPYRCRELDASALISVLGGTMSFLLPQTADDLSMDRTPVFREVERRWFGRGSPTYVLQGRGGLSYPLVPLDGSMYRTIDNTSLDLSWSEFDIQSKYPGLPFMPTFRYQKGFLLRGQGLAPIEGQNVSLRLRTVLDHRDSLYDIEINSSIQGSSGNLTLMGGTYYDMILDCDIGPSGPPWYPLPDLTASFGDGRYPLSSTARFGVWKGTLLTPTSYGSDGELFLHVDLGGASYNGTSIIEHRTYLSRDPTPDFVLSTDPFALPFSGDMEEVRITLRGEWELMNWRLFREAPTVEAGGEPMAIYEVSRDFEYNTTVPVSLGSAHEGRDITVSATTHFEPSETVLLFVKLKGPVLLVWFCIIALAIIISCSVLLGRGLRPLVDGTARRKEAFMRPFLRNMDNDIIATTRTYAGAMFFSITVVLLFQFMAQPTPVPDILSDRVPIWIRMVALANASVWEEIVSRVLMIGLPMSVFALMSQGKKAAVRALLGGHGHVPLSAGALILISSVLFGLAHLGWGPWKVVPTFVMGLIFGYLYVKVGLHASIALHFLFDYNGFLSELTWQEGSFVWTLLFFFTLLAGGALLADQLVKAVEWVTQGPLLGMHKVRVPHHLFLGVHSVVAILFAVLIIVNSGEFAYGLLLFTVPVLDGMAFLIRRRTGRTITDILVYVSSLLTLPAAPIGFAWSLSEDHGSDHRE